MKWFFHSFFIIILLFSCRKPEIEVSTTHTRIIKNNSIHAIKIKNFSTNVINLNQNEEFEIKNKTDGQSTPRTFGFFLDLESDSLEVVFNDTLSVFHGSNSYTVKRYLRRMDKFIFTEEKIGESDHFT